MEVITSKRQKQFDALAHQYSTDLYRFALWLCGDPTQAKDLVQETFKRAWRALDSLRDTKAAKDWMLTILRREHLRTFECKRPPLTDIDDAVIADETVQMPDALAEIHLLRKEITKLPPKYREPMVLQVIAGYSCAEIAAQLNETNSAVMTQLFRARKKLKAALNGRQEHSQAQTPTT